MSHAQALYPWTDRVRQHLGMEAALALPLISLPTQGDRISGLLGPLLLLLLLPLGYVGVYAFASLRDPAWRLLAGIGLALVAQFAAVHHGRAWVEDNPGGGASFRVELPVRQT